jgi:hypothetical protein
MPARSIAQKDSAKAQPDTTKTAVVAEEAPGLISPSLNLVSIQKGDNTVDLSVAMKAKINGASMKLRLLKVSFFQVTDSAEQNLGFLITNGQGKALMNVKADALKPSPDGKLHFKAVFAGNKQMEPAEGEVTVSRARLSITPVKEDSVLKVNVKLVDVSTGAEKPVPETALGIYVKRWFKPQKIGEGTTDANGEASVEVPANLPGDANGNIVLLAKIDENETYGNLETGVQQKWGTPVSDKLNELPRALWSSHPPYWMMITFIILVSTVWGHYLAIIIQLFRLRKEEPAPDSPLVEHILPE